MYKWKESDCLCYSSFGVTDNCSKKIELVFIVEFNVERKVGTINLDFRPKK
jgi:hypothetical protein